MKINLEEILKESEQNFDKINSLLSKLVKYHTPFNNLLQIRKEILNLLFDKQIISNETIKSLLNQYENNG